MNKITDIIARFLSQPTTTWAEFCDGNADTWLGHEELHFYTTWLSSLVLLWLTSNPTIAIIPAIVFWLYRLRREYIQTRSNNKVKDPIMDYYYNTKGMVTGYLVALVMWILSSGFLGVAQ